MNKEEARSILAEALGAFRSKSYEELSALIGSPLNFERKGPSGTEYQIELQVMWDSPRTPGGDIRVIASIDDGRFPSAFMPLTADFIKRPDGGFVGE